MLLEPFCQFLAHQALDDRADLGGDQLVFRLRAEFRVRHFHAEHAGQAFARIIAGNLDLGLLGDAGFVGVFVDQAGQRAAEAGKVGAAIALGDVVGEAEHVLVVAVIPFHRDLDRDAVLLANGVDGLGDQLGLGLVEMLDEGLHAALIHQVDFVRLCVALVAEDDVDAAVQEGQLAQAVFQRLAVVIGHRERAGRGQEAHRRAGIGLALVGHRGGATRD